MPKGFLPPGFFAVDLAKALNLPLHNGNGLDVELSEGFHPRGSGFVLGADPARDGGDEVRHELLPGGCRLGRARPWIRQQRG